MTDALPSDEFVRETWLTVGDAAEKSGFAHTWLTKLASDGHVLAKKVFIQERPYWYIEPDSLEMYIDQTANAYHRSASYYSRLAELRKARGYSMSELVRQLHERGLTITRGTLENWEKKPVKRVDLETTFTLMRFFEVNFEDLFYEVDE